jgi:hypothetical protein
VCIVLLPVAGIIIIIIIVIDTAASVTVGALYQFSHVYGSLIISIKTSVN